MRPTRFVALAVGMLAGCAQAPDASLVIELRLSPTPPSVGPARILLDVTDPARGPVTGATVRIEGRPAARSDAPPTEARARGQDGGRYVVDGYVFDRPGPWTLVARVTTADGIESTREFGISVYSAPP